MNRRDFLRASSTAAAIAAVAPAALSFSDLLPRQVPAISAGALGRLRTYEFAEFEAAMMRAIAAQLAVPYELLMRDYADPDIG